MKTPDQLQISYELPKIEPHITLASFPVTIANADNLALVIRKTLSSWHETAPNEVQKISSLPVYFSALSADDHYFRSVFLDIVLTPELHGLHSALQKAAGEILGQVATDIVAKSPRFPHLSLFYIPDEYRSDRVNIRNALWETYGEDLSTTNTGGQVGFRLPETPEEDHNEEMFYNYSDNLYQAMDASEIWVANCDGPVKDWAILDRIPIIPS